MILGINQQIQGFENEFTIQQADLKKIFDLKYADALAKSKEDEKSAIIDLNDDKLSKEDTSSKIMKIRYDYDQTQASLLEEKMASLEKLEGEHKEKLKKFADSFEFDPHIKLVWDSELSRYNAVMRN